MPAGVAPWRRITPIAAVIVAAAVIIAVDILLGTQINDAFSSITDQL